MKDVGLTRKRRGNYSHANKGQPIVCGGANVPIEEAVLELSNTSSSSSSSGSSPVTSACGSENAVHADYDPNDTSNWTVVCWPSTPRGDASCLIPRSMSTDTGYERTRSRFRVDLMQLTMMTNFNVGKLAMKMLSDDRTLLQSLMKETQWSYLEYVPAMYGSSRCLAAATDCLLAKASTVLSPASSDSVIELRLYAKALSALQDAISDPSSSMEAETLGAIQLMSLHEILDSNRENAWTSHLTGAIRLIKHRSASRFGSEFEKALLAGHVGPVVSEAFMNNVHCYLEEPAWLELYTSVTKDTTFITERSKLVVNARKLMFHLPGLWHDVGEAVLGDGIFDNEILATLEARCRKTQESHLNWLEEYKAHCVRTSFTPPSRAECGLRRDIFGASIECLIVVKRLLACVCDEARLRLELEAQALATVLFDLQREPSPIHSWLLTPHEVGVATSVQVSREAFEEALLHEDLTHQRMATRTRYCIWQSLLRGN